MAVPAISVVLPVFNEEAGVGELYRRTKSVLSATGLAHEIIFVNDGSRDQSWPRILELANGDAAVKAVNLSRNFGHQIAITAGIDLSTGAAVEGQGARGKSGGVCNPRLICCRRRWRYFP